CHRLRRAAADRLRAGGAPRSLERDDVDGLRALVAGLGVVGDLRPLGERLVAVAIDAGVVDEQVLAGLIGRDEAEALVVAEPLHCSGCYWLYLHGVCALRTRRCCEATAASARHYGAGPEVRPDQRAG